MTAPVLEAPGEVLAALARAWPRLRNIAKERTADVQKYTFQFAALDDVIAECRDALAAEGLAVLQPLTSSTGREFEIMTVFVHTSGQSWQAGQLCVDTIPLAGGGQVLDKSDPRNGGRVTYWRRYALLAALGLAAGDDYDEAPAAPPSPMQAELAEREDKAARRAAASAPAPAPAPAPASARSGRPGDWQDVAPAIDRFCWWVEARLNGSTPDDPDKDAWSFKLTDGPEALRKVVALLNERAGDDDPLDPTDDRDVEVAIDAVKATSPERLTQILGDDLVTGPF